MVGLFLIVAVSADVLAPHGPQDRSRQHEWIAATGAGSPPTITNQNLPPSRWHWLGTDSHEHDVLSTVMYGSRLSLLAGLISITLAITLGAPAGAIAGYRGGWADAVIMRGIDIMLAFPSILIALLTVSSLGAGWSAVIIAVGLINVPVFARQVRATVLTVRELEYVAASRAMGATPLYILSRVILPSLMSPVIVLATLGLGSAILEVAGLSFLGIAGDPTIPEWGSMLSEAREHLHDSAWPALAPGIAISLSVLGFNLLGDGLRDALDPRLELQR
jgi:peptide/nickel transport system permease protein